MGIINSFFNQQKSPEDYLELSDERGLPVPYKGIVQSQLMRDGLAPPRKYSLVSLQKLGFPLPNLKCKSAIE
jgi:hypothetical protein